jgi:hypothetical protein
MKPPIVVASAPFLRGLLLSAIGVILLCRPALAFPPAPGFTVFGTVRDEFGWAIDSDEATIVFKNPATGAVMARSTIAAGGVVTENYRATLPLDHGRTTDEYRDDAVTAGTSFTIEVTVQGVTYFPIPTVPTASTQTKSAEFLQLDLTLGNDSDGDGLPDPWEQWQLEAAGLDPAQLDLITRDGDPDGDGLSNHAEFIAGTFVFLGYDTLSLRYVELTPDHWSRLEFLAVIDKAYVLERSADMITWERAPFGLGRERVSLQSDWKAPDTMLQTIETPPNENGTQWFYKLTVH